MKPDGRELLLLRLADLIEKNFDELAELESLNVGKLLAFSKMIDIGTAPSFIRYMAGWATKIEGSTITPSASLGPGTKFHAFTLKEPVGVVAAVIPWNFPLAMALWKLCPALATGCTIVIKPAEQTPLTALRLRELIAEVGIPPGVVNIVTGMGETAGAALTSHPGVDKIAFTGSTDVGKIIARAAAENVTRVSLELGGKSPTIVLPDADVDLTSRGAVNGIFVNHGQVCTAGSRLEQQDRVTRFIESGIKEGARVVAGGPGNDMAGYFVNPTVLGETRPEMKVVREEIFGPVPSCASFEDLDEVVRQANDTRYGLAASIFSNNLTAVHRLIPRIKAGTIWVNHHNLLDPNRRRRGPVVPDRATDGPAHGSRPFARGYSYGNADHLRRRVDVARTESQLGPFRGHCVAGSSADEPANTSRPSLSFTARALAMGDPSRAR